MYIVCIEDNGIQKIDKMTPDAYNQLIESQPNMLSNILYVFDERNDIKHSNMRKENDFMLYHNHYGFAADDLHKRFTSTLGHTNGHVCEFTGLLLHNRRYKCQILDTETNKFYKVTPDFVRRMLDATI